MFATKTNATKALSAHIARIARHDSYARLEHNMAFYSAGDHESRPNRHNVTQAEFEAMFSRSTWDADSYGASKVCYLHAPDGHAFEHIVVKRDRRDGSPDLLAECGIQCYLEIEAWEKLAGTQDGDCLCPVLKYFVARSDHAGEGKRRQRVVIIAQKAEEVGRLREMCAMAESMNRRDGYHGKSANERYAQITDLASRMGWWDVKHNGRNCGVIFDHAAQCWKAVIIDYAL